MLLGQLKDFLDDLLVHIDLHDDAVGICEDLVTLFVQGVRNGHQIRPLGNGGAHIAVLIKHSQPGTHAVAGLADIVGVDLVGAQLADHILTGTGLVHQADKSGPQFTVGNVFGHIPAHAAVDMFHPAHIPILGVKESLRIALNVHKYGSDHHDTHLQFLHFCLCFSIIPHSCHFAIKDPGF